MNPFDDRNKSESFLDVNLKFNANKSHEHVVIDSLDWQSQLIVHNFGWYNFSKLLILEIQQIVKPSIMDLLISLGDNAVQLLSQ